MSALKYILKKEFRQIFRDPAILRMIVMMPALQLIILPFAADYEIKNIRVGVIDHDHSSYSQQLINKIQHSSYFHLNKYGQSYDEGLKWIENESADIILDIPANFEKSLVKEGKSSIFLGANAVNGTKGGLGGAYATAIIQEFNQDIIVENLPLPKYSNAVTINTTYTNLYNSLSNYQLFMVPGILGVLLTMVGSFLAALNIVKEKEIGTIEQLNVSPIKKHEFIIGKLVPFWILGLVSLTIGLIISYFIHGIVPKGSLFVLYSFSIIYLFAILGFGLMISNFTATQQQAMMVAFFFMLIFILLSGLYTPIESMPHWAQMLAACNPVTYMIDVMRKVLLKGADFIDLKQNFIIIGLLGIFLNSISILTYRKRS